MLITAYKDLQGLTRQLGALSRHALCYVHVDARSAITPEQVRALSAMPNVHAVRRYKVNWGSIRHVHALLLLMRIALEDPRVTFLHLMSAQDFPVLPHREFEAFFDRDPRVHMQRKDISSDPQFVSWYRHFHALHLIDYRDPDDRTQTLVGRIDRFQDMLHIKRHFFPKYKSLVWISMPREAACYALKDRRCRRLLGKLTWTYVPEEFFFANAFDGSPFEITEKNGRFCIWDEPWRGNPALLELGDLPRIDASGCQFARKVDPGTPLFEALEARWLSE